MSPFAAELRALAARLDLPEPVRRRVLLEVAADLEDLYAAGLAGGLDERAARARALERVELDDEAIAQLAQVHAGAGGGLALELGGAARTRLATVGLAAGALALLVLALRLASGGGLTAAAGPLGLVSLAGLAAAALVLLVRARDLARREDPRPAAARRAARLLARLAAAQLALGITGVAWSAALSWRRLAGPAPEDGAALLRGALETLRGDCALLSLTGLAAALTALAWHRLAARAETLERRELGLLLELDAAPSPSRSPTTPASIPCSS
jgi:hypothetical protein